MGAQTEPDAELTTENEAFRDWLGTSGGRKACAPLPRKSGAAWPGRMASKTGAATTAKRDSVVYLGSLR